MLGGPEIFSTIVFYNGQGIRARVKHDHATVNIFFKFDSFRPRIISSIHWWGNFDRMVWTFGPNNGPHEFKTVHSPPLIFL